MRIDKAKLLSFKPQKEKKHNTQCGFKTKSQTDFSLFKLNMLDRLKKVAKISYFDSGRKWRCVVHFYFKMVHTYLHSYGQKSPINLTPMACGRKPVYLGNIHTNNITGRLGPNRVSKVHLPFRPKCPTQYLFEHRTVNNVPLTVDFS